MPLLGDRLLTVDAKGRQDKVQQLRKPGALQTGPKAGGDFCLVLCFLLGSGHGLMIDRFRLNPNPGCNPWKLMTVQSQNLFDRALLRRRRERVLPDRADADFLMRRAAREIDERLDLVLRDFPLALDLGAGNGGLAARLAARDNIERVIAADHAAGFLQNLDGENLNGGSKLVCDEEALPFAPASLNLVTSILSLHFVNDLPGALVQIRRALKPDGLFMAALPGGQTLGELRTAFMMAEEELLGGVSPRIAPMADVKEYGALLQRAGFTLPVVDSELVTVSYDSPLKLMRELRLMGAGNVLLDRSKKPVSRRLLQRVVELYEQRFSDGGRIMARFELIYLSGWSPHESQQQPLAPGSAQTSLSAALNACPVANQGDKKGDETKG